MRNRSVAVAVLIALIATAGWWFALYNPQNEQLAAVELEIDGLLARQQQLRNELTTLQQVQADEEEIRAALERLLGYIPEGTTEPQMVRQLQASADSAGVDISSLTLGDPALMVEAPPGQGSELALAEIPLTMVMEGTYFQVVDFLRRLETEGDRAVLVESITMAEAVDGFPQLTTTWAGDIFAELPVVMPDVVAPTTPPVDPNAAGGDASTTDPSTPAPAEQATPGVAANGGQG